MAVLGSGVAEPYVVTHILGGKRHAAVSLKFGHGKPAVRRDRAHGPKVAVAHGFAELGSQPSVVLPGRHDVADVGVRSAGDLGIDVVAQFAAAKAPCLDRLIDAIDMLVGRCGDRERSAVVGCVDPAISDRPDVFGEWRRDDASSILVRVERSGIAAADAE